MGVQVDGAELYSIVAVTDDGISSFATLAGNPTAPPGGPFIVNVYTPLKDRLDESEPDSSTLQGVAGRSTYEVTLADALIATLETGDQGSYRVAPRIDGATGAGASTFNLMSDLKPLPGDYMHFTPLDRELIKGAIDTGARHHTTGFPIYEVELETGTTPAAYADNEALFVVRADACWETGDPVTPLMLLKMGPVTYLIP